MAKKIINEVEIIKKIQSKLSKSIKEYTDFEDLLDVEEDEFTVEPKVKKTPREKQIQNIFGSYGEIVPNDIIRYIRKNPGLIIKRMSEIYGQDLWKYIDKYGPTRD